MEAKEAEGKGKAGRMAVAGKSAATRAAAMEAGPTAEAVAARAVAVMAGVVRGLAALPHSLRPSARPQPMCRGRLRVRRCWWC